MIRHLGICLLLILAVVAVYGQVIRFEFVSLDDRDYVTRNGQVQQGLSWDNVRWALTASGDTGNWHPVRASLFRPRHIASRRFKSVTITTPQISPIALLWITQ